VESTTKALDVIDNKKTGNDNIGSVAEKTIPSDFRDKIDEFKKTQKIVRFKIGDTEIFIYNDKLNKFPTSSINNPKHIYINLDHLSDASKIFGFKSDYVDAYYAFLHELEHSDKKHDAVSTKDWNKYVNSTQEVEAAKRADNWMGNFQSNKTLSEAYHSAKKDGSNPELVKAVEDLLGKKEPANDIPATTKVESVEPVVETPTENPFEKHAEKVLAPKVVEPKKTTRSGIKKAKEKKVEEPITENAGKEVEPPKDLRDEEYPDWVEKNSNNSDEIFNAYKQESGNIPYDNLTHWQQDVLGRTTTKESFERFNDNSNVTQGLAKRFFRKGSQTLDQMALDYDGVTPVEIGNFMVDVSTGKISIRKTTDLQNNLRSKYRKVTGRSIDGHEAWKKEIRDEQLSKEAIEIAENTKIEDIPDKLLNIIDRDGINLINYYEEYKEKCTVPSHIASQCWLCPKCGFVFNSFKDIDIQ